MQPRRLLFLIDRIESSSYPVTETGYAMLYRAWTRAQKRGDELYVAYPDTPWTQAPNGSVHAFAQRVLGFCDSPYRFYQSQRERYRPGEHVGSAACHEVSETETLELDALDAVVWRQESGEPDRTRAFLRALSRVEQHTLVYQSPRLALDPRLGSKVLPGLVDTRFTPRTHHTASAATLSPREKARRAVSFVQTELGNPTTVIAKPLHGDNGVGIHVIGLDPRSGEKVARLDDLGAWVELIERYGDLVVQEYITSVRSPVGTSAEALSRIPRDRRDFGEIRFLLIDGELPRLPNGEICRVARRVPNDDSLIADSGISYPTSLSAAEAAFLTRLGALYRQWGIHFGGGDLIRTPDPERPFVFTDAAQSVCGHAVVTGALNGDPYLMVDRILDSIDHQIEVRGGELRALAQLSMQAG
ncbi:MAG TPA: hypothetical protein VJV78_49380 [Polyangiales bacterium]|nr:hypothetical protein [Polyangiales bacterium]